MSSYRLSSSSIRCPVPTRISSCTRSDRVYRPSGHLSREGSGGFTARHGRPGRALSSPDTWLPQQSDTSRYSNGFSSSCYEDQHHNYRLSPQPSLTPSLTQSGGRGTGGGGSGGGGNSTSRSISVLHHQQQSTQHPHMGDRGSHEQTHDLRDEVGGPSRLGMTVQDLKHMTAMRMGHPRTGGDGGGGGGAGRGSGGGGSNGGAIGDLKGSVLSSAGSPTPDVLSNSSRHRKGLLHLNKTGQEQQQLRTSAPVRESRQEQQRQQQQQHDLQPPPSIVLSRHSSAHAAVGGSPRYPHQRQQQQANGSRGQMVSLKLEGM